MNDTLGSLAHLGWARLLLFATIFVALSVAVPWIIYSEFDGQLPPLDARLLSWQVAITCLLLLFVYFSFDGLRLFYTLKALGYNLPGGHVAKLVFINILFSNLTPMATGGGFAQIWYMRRQGIHLGAATAASTLRTLLASALIFIPTPFLFLFLKPVRDNSVGEQWAVYLGAFALAYATFFIVALIRVRWFIMLINPVLAGLRRLHLIDQPRFRRLRFGIRREMVRFSYALAAYLKGPKHFVALSLLFTILFLMTLFSFPAVLFWALDYQIEYLTIIGLLIVTTFVMYFAPTPGAAGIAEGTFGLLFAPLVPISHLVLVIVVWRFLTIHLGMLIGMPVTLHALTKSGPHSA